MHASSQPSPRAGQILTLATLLALGGILLGRLSSFGIWDPWELETAEAARRLAEGRSLEGGASAAARLASLGFRAFGTTEWAGRLPIALSALANVVIVATMVSRLISARAGRYAAIVLATSPLFILNARPMAGAAPAFLAQTCVAWAGAEALIGHPRRLERAVWLALAVASTYLSARVSGVLMGPLPPLLGLSAVVLVGGLGFDGERRWTSALLLGGTGGLAAATLSAIAVDSAAMSAWTGGTPRGLAPPTYDNVLERAFHAAAPWSALVPLALGQLAAAKRTADSASALSRTTQGLNLLVVVWAAAGYAAQTLYLARYGDAATYLPVAALAILVALWLDGLASEPQPRVAAGIGALLLVGLLVRDFALFPESAIEGLAMARFELPDVFNPRAAWSALLGLFAGLALLVLAVAGREPVLRWTAPYRLLAAQWQRNGGVRAWVVLLGLLLLTFQALGAVAWFAPQAMGLSVLAKRVLRALGFVPVALPAIAAGLQGALWLVARLGRFQLSLVLLSGAMVGVYAGHGFLPNVSGHLSPKEVYETYNRLSGPDEPLAEYGVGSRAAAYYAKGDVLEVEKLGDVSAHLSGEGRRWVALPADKLATVDRQFRKQTRRHLFVANADNARIVLASNQPVRGVENANYFARTVLRNPPQSIEHPLHAVFDKRIELLGYDLELPHDGYVGAGESFSIVWYFKVLGRLGGDRKVFVHIDSADQRVHGDHDPLDGRYPVRLWEPGDILVDRQRIELSATQRPGSYRIYMGLYVGESRTKVTEGPKDASDRVEAGVLRIR